MCFCVCLISFLLDLQRAEIFATERDLAFVQTSAKTGFNIDRLFHGIGKSHMSLLTAATCLTADPGFNTGPITYFRGDSD